MSYENSSVYMIYCLDKSIKDIYIGSCKDKTVRIRNHKHSSKRVGGKLYEFIRNNGGWINFKFKVLEDVNCKTRAELIGYERNYYEILNPTLNTAKPGGQFDDLPTHNSLEYNRAYHVKYRDKLKIKNNTKCECDCGGKHTQINRWHHLKSKKHIKYINQNNNL
tara:strand:+ start:446 stop:937 length:492 start_codon:yes stop_codon:yes gene_type:complete